MCVSLCGVCTVHGLAIITVLVAAEGSGGTARSRNDQPDGAKMRKQPKKDDPVAPSMDRGELAGSSCLLRLAGLHHSRPAARRSTVVVACDAWTVRVHGQNGLGGSPHGHALAS